MNDIKLSPAGATKLLQQKDWVKTYFAEFSNTANDILNYELPDINLFEERIINAGQ